MISRSPEVPREDIEVETLTDSTSMELETDFKLSKKSKSETKVDRAYKSSDKLSKASSKSVQNVGTSMPLSSEGTVDQQKKDDSFTRFDLLQYPILENRMSSHQLRQLCNLVKVKSFSPASYLAQGSAWECLETAFVEPPKPKTDPSSIHKPMPAMFDEIWCPMLADAEDSTMIIPPTFTYLDNGAVKQTLPTLVTGPIRKDAYMPNYY